MRRLLSSGILLLVFQLFVYAQTYRNITTVDGLTNNNVYSIVQDKEGFTWFLSSSGVDRFDGRDFSHYTIKTEYSPIGVSSQYQIITDKNGDIWEVGTRKGNCICKLDQNTGEFEYIPINGTEKGGIHLLFLDKQNRFWLSNGNRVFIYDINTEEQQELAYTFPSQVTCGTELSNEHYVVGMERGIVGLNYSEGKWNGKFIPSCLSQISIRKAVAVRSDNYNLMLFDSKSHFYKINTETGKCDAYVINPIHDIHITDVKPYFNDSAKWFLSTEGRGVFLLDSDECSVTKYAYSDFGDNPGLRGNVILNVFAEDNGKRVWFANHPYGVCCHNIDFPSFTQYKNTDNDENTIRPGVVTEIMQDSEGDIWYATSTGISCHLQKSDSWKHYLRDSRKNDLTYLAICEIRPGVIMASGLMSGCFVIDKYSGKETNVNPQYFDSDTDADYNVRDIYKDDNGIVWLAGKDYLGRIDWDNKTYTAHSLESPAMLLRRKNKDSFWMVTEGNVYSIDIHSGEKRLFNLPDKCADINDIITTTEGTVYIATADEGLFVCSHNPQRDTYDIEQFHHNNSPLITNNIIALAQDTEGNIMMSTDIGVAKYYAKKKALVNWTHLSGIPALGFYKKSILSTSDNRVLYGTYDGVISIKDNVRLPVARKVKTILSDLHINNQPRHISHDAKEISLDYNERQIAFKVGTLNYDNPHAFLYSWKLRSGNIILTNGITNDCEISHILPPGKYNLTIYTYNSADYRIVGEHNVRITIKPSILQASNSVLLSFATFCIILFCIHIFFLYRNKRIAAEEKVDFFIRAAHEIRTPLSLIKAPLEELSNKEKLSEHGYANIQTVIRSANDLLIMTGDLLNIERIKVQQTKLKLYQTDISPYLQELMIPFQLYASTRKLQLVYESTMDSKVWIDRSRMDCILQNLINNAIKYTSEEGKITVSDNMSDTHWSVRIEDTGIGIPEDEIKRLTELFYRSSNITSNTNGTGVGLYLVNKLVEEHKGTMSIESKVGKGTVFTLQFPLQYAKDKNIVLLQLEDNKVHHDSEQSKILVVEDNSELRRFLRNILSEFFTVTTAETADEAYNKVRFIHPDIIVSDIMMPGMQGDELCRKIKSEMETSHIPVILLTARADEASQKEGLEALADAYITKPFSIDILKANIDTILANRKILQKTFANMYNIQNLNNGKETNEIKNEENINGIDVQFIQSVNRIIAEHISDNNLTVDTLCTFVAMSRTSLYNKLKSLTGYSPADYIRMQRIEKSKSLLATTQLTINEIAERCGFGDVKYFREVFKKNTGLSPSQFRNHNNKE